MNKVKHINVINEQDEVIKHLPIGVDAINVDLEDGQNAEDVFVDLQDKIKKKPYYFNNVEEMKSANLKEGDCCITLGYYKANDGGNGEYLIRTKTENDVDDGGNIHIIDDDLVAELIIKDNSINIKQLGARCQDENDNKYDIVPYLEKYMSLLDRTNNRVRLYIPSGIWYCSGYTLAKLKGFDIYGDWSFANGDGDGTIITSLNNNQEYVLQIGNSVHYTRNFSFENITISSADFKYKKETNTFNYSTIKTVLNYGLGFLYAMYGNVDKVFFLKVKGKALKISSSWEIYFGILNFRDVSNIENSIMTFGTIDTTLLSSANITACSFDKIMFEGTHGNLIECESLCQLFNCHFGVINFEDYGIKNDSFIYTTFTEENLENFNEETSNHLGIFQISNGGALGNCVIENIELNNVSTKYFTYNNNNYVYDTLFNITGKAPNISVIVNNITIQGVNKDLYILKTIKDLDNISSYSNFIINNITNSSDKNFLFDVYGFRAIKCNTSLKGYNNLTYKNTDFINFYEITNIYSDESKGSIYSDKEAQTNTNLCVQPYPGTAYHNVTNFTVGGEKILINAKIPAGETAKIILVTSEKSLPIELIGNGEFTNYIADVSSKFDIGTKVALRLAADSTPSSCLLNYYKW